MANLKVYCTPIGFHDAYVAATSQKAALEAWGADANLFARGVADRVTDPALMEEPLSRPGEIIRRARGTPADHFAALPAKVASSKKNMSRGEKVATHPRKKRARPSRSAIETIEQQLTALEHKYDRAEGDLRRREDEIARDRQELKKTHAAEEKRLQRALDNAVANYRRAMQNWAP